MLIDTLSCVEPKQAWICTEDASREGTRELNVDQLSLGARPGQSAGAEGDQDPLGAMFKAAVEEEPWRKVVTLADLRKQYQDELDRITAIQNNQFGFADEDEQMEL